MTEPIPGGYILLSRKLLTNEIMDKPPLYLKLWTWILMKAFWKDHGNLKRGQFRTSIEEMREAMAHKVGYRLVKPSRKEIWGIYDFFTKVTMIVTAKVTHGILVTVLNYERFQDFKSYEGNDEGNDETDTRGTIKRKKGRKKENASSEISLLRRRYPNQELIEKAFAAISFTRKSGRVADSILLTQLQAWEKYPVGQVEAGIRTYLEKNCAAEGKGEKYLLGIIRNQNHKPKQKQSTGSTLLDAYYERHGA